MSYGERQRDKSAQHSRREFQKLAEIGPLPEVVDPERKEACRNDLLAFLTTYFPATTGLKPFSDDHKRIIGRLQRSILFGGRMIACVFRGFAKTTIGENACLWGVMYGHRKFIPLLAADADAAKNNLESLKIELSTNDLLLEDFPEVCHPIRKLENRPQRCATQALSGKHTHIGWTAEDIVLPTVAGSEASGACIRPTGIMACNRGMTHKTADGRQLRPDFVFVDDPQTDESAGSPTQVQKRLDKLHKTVLKLGGHNSELACFIAATVIEKDDLADQLLDPARYQSWQGERVPMVKSWADRHEDLWLGDYTDIRNGYDPLDPDAQKRAHRAATHFYDDHREEMDAGCQVAWSECFNPETELSAIQHAYNMLIDDGPDVFASECQNEPQPKGDGEYRLEPDKIVARWAPDVPRGKVPHDAHTLTAFIDVQDKMLFWGVFAWHERFGGVVVDYGAWPDQRQHYYSLRQSKRTLGRKYPKRSIEAAWLAGLHDLTEHLLAREWPHAGAKGGRAIDLCLIDSGYGDSKNVVYRHCRESPYGSRLRPSKGVGVRASDRPMSEWLRSGKGFSTRRRGYDWTERYSSDERSAYVLYNANTWKTLLAHRLLADPNEPHALRMCKEKTPARHRMFAEHLCAEKAKRVDGRTGETIEWSLPPAKPDNHFWDCLVGGAVAASIQGVRAEGHEARRRRTAKPSSSLMERQKSGKRRVWSANVTV